jgi:hypothetical protein
MACPKLRVVSWFPDSPKYPAFYRIEFCLSRAYNRTDVMFLRRLGVWNELRTLPVAYPVRVDSANLAGVADPSLLRGRESRINEDRTGNLACDSTASHPYLFQEEEKHRAAQQQHQW